MYDDNKVWIPHVKELSTGKARSFVLEALDALDFSDATWGVLERFGASWRDLGGILGRSWRVLEAMMCVRECVSA